MTWLNDNERDVMGDMSRSGGGGEGRHTGIFFSEYQIGSGGVGSV